MNAITVLVITTALGADTGWVHTTNGSPRYQANYDGNVLNRGFSGPGFSGPAIPQYSHADVYANQQPIDDLPDRPRIDSVPFAERSQLGFTNQRTGFNDPNGNRIGQPLGLPPNQGFPPNNNSNPGFNAPNNPSFTGASNPGFNAPNNPGFNNNGFNNNGTNIPPLTPVNPNGQPTGFGQPPGFGQNPNQFGSPNVPGFSNSPNNYSSQLPNTQGNPNGWSNTPNNGLLTPPPTNRFNTDPNFDSGHSHRSNNFGANGNGYSNQNGYANNQPGYPNNYGNGNPNSGFNNSGFNSPGFGNNQNALPSFNGNGQRQVPFGNTINGHSEAGFGSNPNGFGRDDLHTADARNANFPPLNNDLNRLRSTIPTASITRNSVQQGFSSTFASLLLFASLGGNIYLGWLARDFYWRFRDMAWEMRGHSSSSN